MAKIEIIDLHASVLDKEIIKGLNLSIKDGETHAIMGPNGSGKSTLSNIIAGNPEYQVTKGKILFDGKDILPLKPEERSRLGVFLSFQSPVEIPGVSILNFIKQSINSKKKANNEEEMDTVSFLKMVKPKALELGINNDMLKRPLNVGFSGGEKKRIETLQIACLEPSFCILDEMDSGLDIDALKTVADGINAMKNKNRSFLVITHYQRLLDYIIPDFIHILYQGRIVKSGGKELALELEKTGYADYMQ